MCFQVCGEMSVLSSRVVINKAILLEEMRRLEEAYDYFYKGLLIKVEVSLASKTVVHDDGPPTK